MLIAMVNLKSVKHSTILTSPYKFYIYSYTAYKPHVPIIIFSPVRFIILLFFLFFLFFLFHLLIFSPYLDTDFCTSIFDIDIIVFPLTI